MEEVDSEMNASSDEEETDKKKEKQVYLPHKPIEADEELVCDKSAYLMLKDFETGAPCLSFDIIPDDLGNDRWGSHLSFYLVAGTQAEKSTENRILLMKASNLHREVMDEDDDDDDDDEDSFEDETKTPKLEHVSVSHMGCTNRIRVTAFRHTIYGAAWSELKRVSIWNFTDQIQALDDPHLLAKYRSDKMEINSKPVFTFTGHQSEGFAVDWSTISEGMLVTGDSKKYIHLWHPRESGWRVDQKPLLGHLASVEDLQWSPNEQCVFASASVDKSIRIWDIRETGNRACMIAVENAHEKDVNVISWNKQKPFIISGGDDGCIHVWDLRSIKSGKSVATFKHHTKPITTIEWHPTDETVFASGGEDDQIGLWDLAVEKDSCAMDEDIEDLPPQLLFIHQGQKEIKELHWHPQIEGLVVSTALSGFNVFRTISV